jgi:GDP-4-dehydro-6-deoxy-D-mannose reductase
MTKKILITGAAGFFGRYMYDYLNNLHENFNLICTDLIQPTNIRYNDFVTIDLSQSKPIEELIKQTKPDYIIHLAGIFGNKVYQDIYRGNVLSTAILSEAIRKYAPDTIVITTGSAAEYGNIAPQQLPVDEQTGCTPITVYGLTKYLSTQIALYYYRVHALCIMVIRPFQLIGKGVPSHLVPGAFAEQLKENIAKGSKTIKVGNLESSRDFLDIHDAVEATWMLCQHPAPGEIFNLCSGKPTKIKDLLHLMIDNCKTEVNIEVDSARKRGNADVSTMYGNYQKLSKHCGWRPKRTLAQSIQSMFS